MRLALDLVHAASLLVHGLGAISHELAIHVPHDPALAHALSALVRDALDLAQTLG